MSKREKDVNVKYTDTGPSQKGFIRSGQHPVYYIPFSKEKVDEIIANSDDTYRENIAFTIDKPYITL